MLIHPVCVNTSEADENMAGGEHFFAARRVGVNQDWNVEVQHELFAEERFESAVREILT